MPAPGQPEPDLIPSLLAASDPLGTGWFGAVAAEAGPGKTVASLSCRLHAAHPCGDHHIVIREVESVEA